MLTSDFHYELPAELIAQTPLARRTDSRLLVLDAQSQPRDHAFTDLSDYLRAGDLLVLNDTRVIPARLYGAKQSGGRVEILLERMLDAQRALVHVRASKPPKPGGVILLEDATPLQMLERHDDLFELQCGDEGWLSLLQRLGHTPLPPYIERDDTSVDLERYQTVYAAKPGAVAAPTAGLHFDEAMLAKLDAQGINRAYVTLHVGAGTFQPVRVANLQDHPMHAEQIEVSAELVQAVARCKAGGGRVVAVGTTAVRSLESAAASGELQPFNGMSRLFIYPGYRFHVVDAMVTNFHLPESTLLMLVSAFAGYVPVMEAYRHAVAQRYRFFSYGDAMFLEKPLSGI